MAGEWREVTLGEIAELVRGVSYRPADLLPDSSNGIPLLRATNIRDGGLDLGDVLFVPPELVQPNQMLRRYDVVIAMSSGSREAVGRLAQLRQDWIGCVGAFCAVIRADPRGVHPDFLGFVLQSPDFRTHVETHAVGTAIMNLSRERILGFSLKLPPLPEQRAIAHILGTLDDKIELNRRMSETLEAMARALFKAWFVDFEPVRAKMEGRWQRGQSLPGLPAHLYDLFPDRLVDSELGEIPEGWRVARLGDFVVTIKGRSYKSEELVEGSDVALVTLKSFARGGGYRPDGLKPFAGCYKQEQVVKPGEVVVACTDVTQAAEVIGRAAMVRRSNLYRDLVASLDTLIVRPKTSDMTVAFLYSLLRTDAFVEHTYAHVTGTTVLHLAKDAVPSFTFALPPEMLVHIFDGIAGIIFSKVETLELENDTLAALRDAFLPKLIRGEIRVKEAERFLKERGP